MPILTIMAMLTTIAILTMAILTMAILTMAILTMACLTLKAGELSLSELLKQGQLKGMERKHLLERLVSVLEYLHSKQLVCIDLKPQVTPTATLTLTLQNLVLFGSILDVKLIDLECIRKVP